MLDNELLMEATSLVNSNEEAIAELHNEVEIASGCCMCGYGHN